MKAFFRFFAERHLLANVLTVMALLMGGFSLLTINRSELPKVDYGVMTIVTHYPGASPEDVELNVTNKIEDELKSVNGIKRLVSVSMENNSGIKVWIDSNVPDVEKVKQNIREAVGQVTNLPPEVKDAPLVTEENSDEPILEVGITGDLPYSQLREYARLFEKKLKALPGIAQVKRSGYRAREVKIEVLPEKLIKYQIPLQTIMAKIQAENVRASGGSLESYASEKSVLTLAQFSEPQEVGDVIVHASPEGGILRVKDLAIISDGFETERQSPRINGTATISFTLRKRENADIVRTGDAVKALIEREKSRLPKNSPIDFVYTTDESSYIRNRFAIVKSNGLMGLVLVLVVLSFFLNVRGAFWVALGIPFSLLGVLCLLPFFDSDLDGVTLTAMVVVIGIIVDDAIVIAENIFRRRELGDAPLEAAVNGIHEVYLPVLTTISTTVLAFLPMFYMKGELGLFVRVVPLTICLALALSLFESFFILPSHILSSLHTKKGKGTGNFGRTWFRPVRERFERLMVGMLRLRYVWLAIGLLFLAGTLFYAVNVMDFVLFPSKGADIVYGRLLLPVGSSLEATSDRAKEIEAILESLPEGEIQSYAFYIGAGGFFGSENSARFKLNLTPYAARQRKGLRKAAEIVEDVRSRASAVGGVEDLSFEVYSRGVHSGKAIEIMLIGSDDVYRKNLADDIERFLQQKDGVKDVERNDRAGKEEITIDIDRERLARYGLSVADIALNVRVAYDGEVVTSIRSGEEDLDFRVILGKEYRRDLDSLRQLRIPNAAGELIALDEVAELRVAPGASAFFHYGGERSITVTADVSQEITSPMAVMEAVSAHFTPEKLEAEYPGVRFASGGEAEESRKAMIDLVGTFGLAALGIYFLLLLLFNSPGQPIIVLLSIPFGISGVIMAFALHGEPFSFLGMMGVIGMAGVVVNDSLVLVDHLNQLLSDEETSTIHSPAEMLQQIAHGAANRLRPILLTTLTTIAGLLPLTYGIGGHDIYMGPMAMSLGYGLLFATPITLILVPSLYTIAYDIKRALKVVRSKVYPLAYGEKAEPGIDGRPATNPSLIR